MSESGPQFRPNSAENRDNESVEWKESAKITGSFWYGKISGSDDYETHNVAGAEFEKPEAAAEIITAYQRTDKSRPGYAAIYQPDPNTRECFLTVPTGTDAAGRADYRTFAYKTNGEMNPADQALELFTMHNQSERVKAKTSGRIELHEKQKAILEKQPSKNDANDIAATLMAGKNATVTLGDLRELSENHAGIVRNVKWIVMPYTSGVSAKEFTEEKGEPGLILTGKDADVREYAAADHVEFLDKVGERFKEDDANFDTLFEQVSENPRRHEVVSALVNNQLNELDDSHRNSLPWIRSVASDEEYQQAKSAIG